MSETTPGLFDRFLSLPRAMQWALLAALGTILFFAWDAYVAPLNERIARQADFIANQVQEIRANRALAGELNQQDLKSEVTAIGPVKPPRSAAAGGAAFTDIITELMKKYGIAPTDQDFSLRSRGKLPKNALVQVLGGKRAERLDGDLKFSAKPEIAVQILAELESSPDIEQVSAVRLTKDQNGKVKVQYTLEAWVIASEGNSAAAGAAL